MNSEPRLPLYPEFRAAVVVLFLHLLFLSSCQTVSTPVKSSAASASEQQRPSDPTALAFAYPYGVIDRIDGADGILWYHDRTDCPVDPEQAEIVIEDALEAWHFPGTCSFRRASSVEEAVLTIGWRSSDHGSPCFRFGVGEALIAHRVTSPRSGDQTPYSIHLNAGVSWRLDESPEEPVSPLPGLRINPRSRPRLASVIVHEAGHVLGLGHVANKKSVMHPLQGEAASEPAAVDLMAVQSLYGGGGEAVTDADLRIHCVAPDGELHLAAPVIRGLAPEKLVRVHAVDLDGDDREELLLLGIGRPAEGTGLLILTFEEGALLNRTLGPFPGMLDGTRPLAFGRTTSGDSVLAQPVGQQGRYHAILLLAGRPPLRVLPPQASWFSIDGGGGDVDGDGVLDSPIHGMSSVKSADLDGDGTDELVLQGRQSD